MLTPTRLNIEFMTKFGPMNNTPRCDVLSLKDRFASGGLDLKVSQGGSFVAVCHDVEQQSEINPDTHH